MTWNVNSLRARLPRVLQFLAEHRPDVACLQETKCAPDTFPLDALADAGYDAVHHSGGQWAGVALLARAGLRLEEPRLRLPGDPATVSSAGADAVGESPEARITSEARWCEATVAGIRFASTYVPNGRTLDSPEYPRKLAFLTAIRDHAAALPRPGQAGPPPAANDAGDAGDAGTGAQPATPWVIAGDFNIAPADADVYDPAAFIGGTHVSAPERARLTAILDTGLVDCYRALHPDTPQFTWWDYRAGHFHKGLGLRIDLVLAAAELAPRLRRCAIERNYRKGQKPSDHAPLVVELDR